MIDDIWWYRARFVKAIDGDTVEVLVDHGMHVHSTQRLRLLGVFAPERNEVGGPECKAEVTRWCTEGATGDWPLVIHTEKDRRTFDRYVADIYKEQLSLNTHMRSYIPDHGYGGGSGSITKAVA